MIDVVMPKMGESITEGTVLEWKKKVGDTVSKDETILEISTDKVDSEVPSPGSGILLEIIANVNDTVPVGDVIARIGNSDEKIHTESENQIVSDIKTDIVIKDESISESKEALIDIPKVKEIPKTDKSFKRFYSPLIKSIAKKEGISLDDLDYLPGSGKNGRLNKQDLLLFLKNKSPIGNMDAVPSDSGMLIDKVEPMSRMRKKIADHMVKSVHTSPHVYTTVEADVTNLVNICSDLNESFQKRSGVNLTYTPMILDACIRTIQEYPLLNASLEEENIIHHQNINMGLAVALPDNNLVVPVIASSEEKNFLGLARSTADLADRARNNDLQPEEIFGSTFTVTNPGVFGGLFGMGIINQPNVGILAVGSFQKRPVVKETEYGDTIIIRTMVYLTLSYDHRIIDGAYGTRFLSRLVEKIEKFNIQRIDG